MLNALCYFNNYYKMLMELESYWFYNGIFKKTEKFTTKLLTFGSCFTFKNTMKRNY